ncbi:hypothetical protein Ctob_012151 [Chrysochromulina tobinii]|uniref:Uncharacterized protein n=1 Tax=Chrysochromulina tobinii TaxID=1460289 RepID=A0A0M0K338_9EUKA|nr:hypothetical protein Ctob_012151 [Chrysochromulina tobinii]|eukprot:KOO33286.1 hypothetical protein Ctob_012151 [Chrysochromulina sp. CCMP291]
MESSRSCSGRRVSRKGSTPPSSASLAKSIRCSAVRARPSYHCRRSCPCSSGGSSPRDSGHASSSFWSTSAEATDRLKLSTKPYMGRKTRRSAAHNISFETPKLSDPRTMASRRGRCTASSAGSAGSAHASCARSVTHSCRPSARAAATAATVVSKVRTSKCAAYS